LVAPEGYACTGALANADGGESATAHNQSSRVGEVDAIFEPGGVGPNIDLACPYIPSVAVADNSFRQGQALCTHPSGETITPIDVGPSAAGAPIQGAALALVRVPAGVTDASILGTGSSDATDALFAATVYNGSSGPLAAAQAISCTLPTAEWRICLASLEYFLRESSLANGRPSGEAMVAFTNADAELTRALAPISPRQIHP
jgi:hypothetical protein